MTLADDHCKAPCPICDDVSPEERARWERTERRLEDANWLWKNRDAR